MRVRAAVIREMMKPRPYRESRPFAIEEVDLAPPGEGEVLVRIRAAGLCHSDLSTINGDRPRQMPMVLGHEAAGEVAELGPGVKDLAVGDHVIMVFVPSCGGCLPCMEGRPALCEPGAAANNAGTLLSGARRLSINGDPLYHHVGVSAFAEHAVVARQSLVKIDRDLAFEEAALFGCAVVTGAGAVLNTARLPAGSSVAVVGLGGVGLMSMLAARTAGARQIVAIDTIDEKLQLARQMGATHTVNAMSPDAVEQVRDLTGGGVEFAFETASSVKALETAYRITRRGGTTVTASLPHPDLHEDVKWLGFDWGEHEYYASDYFQQLYDWAVLLIKAGKAYVDDLSADEIRAYRGTLTEPGRPSPYRDRPVAESLDLFERMRKGEFANGEKVLRAKIDMASPNVTLRDPVMYRILHASHPRTGDTWCIYPMYDWAHGQSDWIEGVTHSICTLEFVNNRALYDWFVEALQEAGATPPGVGYRPHQHEFARLQLTHTVLSKRKLLELVKTGLVNGWDDPRMPTLSAYRRRGYTPSAIRAFCQDVGVGKFNAMIDIGRLENALREELNRTAPRRMAVLHPLKVIIDNYPDGQTEEMDAINNPEDASAGTRKVPFGKVLYIEQDDFREDAPPKYFRLTPGREVRLRYAYFIKCTHVEKDADGRVTAVHCTYDPETRGGNAPDGRKVKSTIHWVSAEHAIDAEVRLYDHLFKTPEPDDVPEGQDWKANINPESLVVVSHAKLEPSLSGAPVGSSYQFERTGYFCVDRDSTEQKLVLNRSVSLKDTWAKVQKKG